MMGFVNDHSFQFTRIKLLQPFLIVKGLIGRDCAGEIIEEESGYWYFGNAVRTYTSASPEA
jgi:hypothetical protein